MKVLVLDWDGVGLAFSMDCLTAGHSVRLWIPKKGGQRQDTGDGLVERPADWQPSMKWADIIVMTDNSHLRTDLKPYFTAGFPIFGANDQSAELELDRAIGQEVLESNGVDTLPYETFSNFDKAIAYVKRTDQAYACKPWGGLSDKSLTYVSNSPDDMVFTLERWRDSGTVKGEFMLQQKVDGIEMGIAGWFGPGGWSGWLEESWEHKKRSAGDLGCNTGEMGTALRYVRTSKLFNRVLKPVEEELAKRCYVGDVSVNCIIDKEKGTPWPMEFTTRLGWPDFNIRVGLHEGDPVEWMLDLMQGKDTLKAKGECAIGVVLVHGKFPWEQPAKELDDFPIYGLTGRNMKQVALQAVKAGKAKDPFVTAGNYIAVVRGTGKTFKAAADSAYRVVDQLSVPSNLDYRIDIGDKLRKQLPILQSFGYAKGAE